MFGAIHPKLTNLVWCPFKLGDIEEIEEIQKRATKFIIKLKHKPYKERLIHPNLPTLSTDSDVEVCKIIHNINIYDTKESPQLIVNERGNNYKLLNHNFHYNLRKHFFLYAP